MKHAIWMAVLLLPLAGCRQQSAQLAPSEQGQTFVGPVTLRYQFNTQEPTAFRLNVDGQGTGSFQRSPNAAREPVTAQMNSEMVVEQRFAPTTAPYPQAEQPTPAPGSTVPPSEPPGGTGAQPGQTPTAEAWQLTQTVQSWTANLQLPDRPLPNQFQAQFENGRLSVNAQGVPVNVPATYRDPVEQTLTQPLTAVVTQQGEVLQVDWPAPARYPMRSEEAAGDSSRQFYYFTGNSIGPVNLWMGVIRLPEQSINVGDTWRASEQMPVSFRGASGSSYEMQREAHYVLRELLRVNNERVAVIDVTETLRVAPGEGASAAQAPADLMQTRNGTVRFNIDRGAIENAQQEFTVSWDTTVSRPETAAGQSAQTQPVATAGQARGTLRVERISGASAPQAATPGAGTQYSAPSATSPSGTTPSAGSRPTAPQGITTAPSAETPGASQGTAPSTGTWQAPPQGTVPITGAQPSMTPTVPQGTTPSTGMQPSVTQPSVPQPSVPQPTVPSTGTQQTNPRLPGGGAQTPYGTEAAPSGIGSGTTPGGLTQPGTRAPTR